MGTTGHMPLTGWGNHISKIIENRWYQITDIVIRKYYGTKLSTTPMSIFEEIEKESTLDSSDMDVPNYSIAKCISCKRKMLVKGCVDGFEHYIDVKSKDQVVTLQTDFQVLLNYFDVKKCNANLDEVEDKLLDLEDFSITYIASSTIVHITSVGSA